MVRALLKLRGGLARRSSARCRQVSLAHSPRSTLLEPSPNRRSNSWRRCAEPSGTTAACRSATRRSESKNDDACRCTPWGWFLRPGFGTSSRDRGRRCEASRVERIPETRARTAGHFERPAGFDLERYWRGDVHALCASLSHRRLCGNAPRGERRAWNASRTTGRRRSYLEEGGEALVRVTFPGTESRSFRCLRGPRSRRLSSPLRCAKRSCSELGRRALQLYDLR